MLEDLRENVLTLLEERVERAIETINRLREEKLTLESENNQLRNDLDQRDVQIQNLEQRNAELNHFESEILVLRNEREQERLDVDKEKAEVRERLEGLMTMLNNVENRSESQEAAQPSVPDYTSETVDNSETVDDEEEQQETEQSITPNDTLFIPTALVKPQEAEQPSDSDDTSEETVNETDDETDDGTDDETEFA
jgi:FtsZ-binding cell division protein ZapB